MNTRTINDKTVVLDVPNVLGCTYVMYKTFYKKAVILATLAIVWMYIASTSMYIGGGL